MDLILTIRAIYENFMQGHAIKKTWNIHYIIK